MRVRLSLDAGGFRVDLNELPKLRHSRCSRYGWQRMQSIRRTYTLSIRPVTAGYDQAAAEVQDGVEPILFNERGEITK